MTTRQIAWQRRAPTLLIAGLLHLLIIAVFLRGLTTAGRALLESPMLVSIVAPPPSSAPLPPVLHAPKLPESPPIPPLIAPAVLIPNVISAPAAPPPAPPPKSRVQARTLLSTGGPVGDARPQYLSGPLDADDYYPMAARVTFAQGHVWTRVCVYSTGNIASVSLVQTSGDKALDDAALTLAHLTRWKPALVEGKPVARCSPFRVNFAMNRIGFD